MPTSVALTSHFEALAQRLVADGRYNNISEVVRDGLRLLEDQVVQESAKLAGLRRAAKLGFTAIEDGRFEEISSTKIDNFIGAVAKQAINRRRH